MIPNSGKIHKRIVQKVQRKFKYLIVLKIEFYDSCVYFRTQSTYLAPLQFDVTNCPLLWPLAAAHAPGVAVTVPPTTSPGTGCPLVSHTQPRPPTYIASR